MWAQRETSVSAPLAVRLGPCDSIPASGMWVQCCKLLPGWAIDYILPLSLKTLEATYLRWWHEKMEGTRILVFPQEKELLGPNTNEKYILVLLNY